MQTSAGGFNETVLARPAFRLARSPSLGQADERWIEEGETNRRSTANSEYEKVTDKPQEVYPPTPTRLPFPFAPSSSVLL